MKLFEGFRKNIGTKLLVRNTKALKRNKGYFNLDTARNVGVIFDATHQETYLQSREFCARMAEYDIKVLALGYVEDEKAIEYFPESEWVKFFSLEKVNWRFESRNPFVNQFTAKSFDILFDITLSDHLTIRHIVGNSMARFKLGFGEDPGTVYDMVINVGENRSLPFFIQQIVHFLGVLKVRYNEPLAS